MSFCYSKWHVRVKYVWSLSYFVVGDVLQSAMPVLDLCHNCNKSCNERGGAMSVMPVIRGDTFSQQATAITQWADTIIGRYAVIGCKLQVLTILYTRSTMLMRAARLVQVLQDLLQVLS